MLSLQLMELELLPRRVTIAKEETTMPAKRPRPEALPGITYRMPTSCGKIYVTITKDSHGRPFEVFVRFVKAGHCGAAIFDGMTKLIFYALRSGMDPTDAVKALTGIVCTHGRPTAVAEALGEVVDAFSGHSCGSGPVLSTPPSGEASPSLQAPGHEAP